MLISIKNVFNNLSSQLAFLTFTGIVLFLLILEVHTSFEKINILKMQKILVEKIVSFGREDLELSSIQLRGKSTQLVNEVDRLKQRFNYDVTAQYIFGQKDDYFKELDHLEELTVEFTEAANAWYDPSTKHLPQREEEMKRLQWSVINYIDQIMENNNAYFLQKVEALLTISFVLVFGMLMITMWYSRKLSKIAEDIRSLYAVDFDLANFSPITHDVEAIAKRMNRKPTTSENPAMMDPITGVNNYKGLLHEYGNKKLKGSNNFTGVCVFEVDNLRTMDKKLPKEFTQAVLKKIGFMMSLHQQHTDVLARIDYDKFAIVLSRKGKDLAYNDCELIRKSVEDTVFKVPKGSTISVTISGGFAIKPGNKSLDDSITQAKEILQVALKGGRNKIAQIRDLAEHA